MVDRANIDRVLKELLGDHCRLSDEHVRRGVGVASEHLLIFKAEQKLAGSVL